MEVKDKGCDEFRWYDEPMGADPLEVLIRKERREQTLATLTDKQREVFILYHKYGYVQSEIAEMLGISRDSVNDRLEGAHKKIRKYETII